VPLLAQLFVSLFGGLIGFFAQWVTKKMAIGLATATVFGGLTVVMYGALSAALNVFAVTMPSYEGMNLALWVAAPANLPAAVGSVLAADAAMALYAWNVKLLRMVSQS